MFLLEDFEKDNDTVVPSLSLGTSDMDESAFKTWDDNWDSSLIFYFVDTKFRLSLVG